MLLYYREVFNRWHSISHGSLCNSDNYEHGHHNTYHSAIVPEIASAFPRFSNHATNSLSESLLTGHDRGVTFLRQQTNYCFYVCISLYCAPLSLSIWYYLWFSRATVSAVNCLFVLPPLFIILALLPYLANKLIDWLIEYVHASVWLRQHVIRSRSWKSSTQDLVCRAVLSTRIPVRYSAGTRVTDYTVGAAVIMSDWPLPHHYHLRDGAGSLTGHIKTTHEVFNYCVRPNARCTKGVGVNLLANVGTASVSK